MIGRITTIIFLILLSSIAFAFYLTTKQVVFIYIQCFILWIVSAVIYFGGENAN